MEYNKNKLLSDNKAYRFQDVSFIILAGAAIIASAFHFWPFENNRVWQMLNIPNLCCAIVLAVAVFLLIFQRGRSSILLYMPHVSILVYLTINILSISGSNSLWRPLNYTVKLVLVFLGGLLLFQKAMAKSKMLSLFYTLIAATVSLSILACIYTRLTCDIRRFGFYDNVFKYGTYMGILVPLASIYLISGSALEVLWGVLIIITTGIFSVDSAGAILSIFAGLIIGLIISRKTSVRLNTLICILLLAATLFLSNQIFDRAVSSDFSLKEHDGSNLRQRYIEWQAELNLLEKRGVTGTGAGCVNDYRGNFYYRLPKLNTLKAFDQNGFLAVGAETGLLGLTGFIWILVHYGRISFRDFKYLQTDEMSLASRMTSANMAAFISALVANLFSSVHYNGILIVLVLLFSLISSVNRIYGKNTDED